MNHLQKAEEWLTRIKRMQTDTKYPEHVKEHAEILEWLIERVKENE